MMRKWGLVLDGKRIGEILTRGGFGVMGVEIVLAFRIPCYNVMKPMSM